MTFLYRLRGPKSSNFYQKSSKNEDEIESETDKTNSTTKKRRCSKTPAKTNINLTFFLKYAIEKPLKSLSKPLRKRTAVWYRFRNSFLSKKGLKMMPKCLQNRPQIDKKSYQKLHQISVSIFKDFYRFLAALSPRTGTNLFHRFPVPLFTPPVYRLANPLQLLSCLQHAFRHLTKRERKAYLS